MIHVLEVFIKVLYLGIEHTIDVSCILLIKEKGIMRKAYGTTSQPSNY